MIATPSDFYAELLDVDPSTGKDIPGFPFHKILENICMDFHEKWVNFDGFPCQNFMKEIAAADTLTAGVF